MRFVPTYRQTLYLVLALALLVVTGTYLHSAGSRVFLVSLAFAVAVLGGKELVTDIISTDAGDPQ